MKRAQKKQIRIARATQQAENYAVNKIIAQLKENFKAELEMAKSRNKDLEQQIESLKQELKSERSKLKQAKAANLKIREYTASVTKKFSAQLKSFTKGESRSGTKVKTATMSKEQVFEYYRNVNQSHFWSRVLSVVDWSDPNWTEEEAQYKLAEAQQIMDSWSSERIREFIRYANLRSTWYDSDST